MTAHQEQRSRYNDCRKQLVRGAFRLPAAVIARRPRPNVSKRVHLHPRKQPKTAELERPQKRPQRRLSTRPLTPAHARCAGDGDGEDGEAGRTTPTTTVAHRAPPEDDGAIDAPLMAGTSRRSTPARPQKVPRSCCHIRWRPRAQNVVLRGAACKPPSTAHSYGCGCALTVTFPPQNIALRGTPPRTALSAGWGHQQRVNREPPRQSFPLHRIAAARPPMPRSL